MTAFRNPPLTPSRHTFPLRTPWSALTCNSCNYISILVPIDTCPVPSLSYIVTHFIHLSFQHSTRSPLDAQWRVVEWMNEWMNDVLREHTHSLKLYLHKRTMLAVKVACQYDCSKDWFIRHLWRSSRVLGTWWHPILSSSLALFTSPFLCWGSNLHLDWRDIQHAKLSD